MRLPQSGGSTRDRDLSWRRPHAGEVDAAVFTADRWHPDKVSRGRALIAAWWPSFIPLRVSLSLRSPSLCSEGTDMILTDTGTSDGLAAYAPTGPQTRFSNLVKWETGPHAAGFSGDP